MRKLFLSIVLLVTLGICTPIVAGFIDSWLNTDIGISVMAEDNFNSFLASGMKFLFPLAGLVGIILWLVNSSNEDPDGFDSRQYTNRIYVKRVKKIKKIE